MRITKKGWIEIASCTLGFIVIAIIAAFFDLQINHALYKPDSLFGQFFALLGDFPSYVATPLVGVILYFNDIGKNKKQKTIFKIISAGVVFAGWIFAFGTWFWENFMQEISYKWLYIVLFSLILTTISLWAGSKIDVKIMKKLLVLAVFIAIFVALSNVMVQVLKIIWQRQRYRTMAEDASIYAGTFEGFSPWYKPEFIFKNPIRTEAYMAAFNDGDGAFKSFPSGHTVSASALFMLILIPDIFPKFKKYNYLFWIIPGVYTAIVGLSRIVVGAHFLSDVLFGGFIDFVIAALARWILVSKRWFFAPDDEPLELPQKK